MPSQRFQEEALALSPCGRFVAYSANTSGRFDLWVHPLHGGAARSVARLPRGAVRDVVWSPDGASLIFAADEEGDELHRLYRVSVEDGAKPEELVASPGRHYSLATQTPLDPTGRYLAYATNDRDVSAQDVVVHDLTSGQRRRFVPSRGAKLLPVGISPDGRWLLIASFLSDTDSTAIVANLLDANSDPIEVTDHQEVFEPVGWSSDSSGFLVRTDRWNGEFASLGLCDPRTLVCEPVCTPEWDVEHASASGDLIVWVTNEDGSSVLHGQRNGEAVALPDLPHGQISRMRVSADGVTIALHLDTPVRPAEIAFVDLSSGTWRYLTDSRPAGLRVREAVPSRRVSYPSAQGRRISAQVYVPPGDGPFPTLVWIHGGPHGQERPVYARSGLYQYLLTQGIAIIGPDMAGSNGYGTSFERLIYRDWGGVDLEDFAATADYLESAPWADENRLAVAGGSYGGFAALSCLARIDRRWAAGVSICGPSNLVTLAAACPPSWRGMVDRILGNPDTDAEHLLSRSPITYADNINAPLYVVQGANDPRVPRSESDQIVQLLRQRGTEVHYDVYADEGHGFTNRHNELEAYAKTGRFLIEHLLS